jgi:subfamily B ATP-binding cassette protein MsbA
VEYTILTAYQQLLTAPIALICYLLFLFYIDYQLTLWSLLLIPASFLLIGFLSHALRRSSKTYRQRLGVLLSHVEETLSCLRVIYGFNAQKASHVKFDKLNRQFLARQLTVFRLTYLASPLSEFLSVIAVMVVLVIGGLLVLSERSSLSAPLFITYIALFSQIIEPIKNISSAVADYRRGQASMERIQDFLDIADTVEDAPDAIPVQEFRERLDLQQVTFAYEEEPVLREVSLTIPKGSSVAFVGTSGSGKSTLVDLLMRFYDPQSGVIALDGVPAIQYKIGDYRSLFALVSQDVILFHPDISCSKDLHVMLSRIIQFSVSYYVSGYQFCAKVYVQVGITYLTRYTFTDVSDRYRVLAVLNVHHTGSVHLNRYAFDSVSVPYGFMWKWL